MSKKVLLVQDKYHDPNIILAKNNDLVLSPKVSLKISGKKIYEKQLVLKKFLSKEKLLG